MTLSSEWSPRQLAYLLISTSRFNLYMPYYTMLAAVWSTLIAGALKLTEDPTSIPVEDIFGRASFCFMNCLLLCGAGTIWNDLLDRDIDAKVERTRTRPLESGYVSTVEALVRTIGQYLLFVKTVDLTLDGQNTWRLVLALTCCIILYPFMKRPIFSKFFIYPQYILGLAVGYPAITGWSSINGHEQSLTEIVRYCTPICLLVSFWCVYFNTAYGHQDSVDDRKMNINSAYVVAGERIRMFLAFLSVLLLAVIPFVVSKINSPWMWFSWMAVWTGAIGKQILQFDSKKLESGGAIHWENFLLGLWTIVACMVEVCFSEIRFLGQALGGRAVLNNPWTDLCCAGLSCSLLTCIPDACRMTERKSERWGRRDTNIQISGCCSSGESHSWSIIEAHRFQVVPQSKKP